MILAQHVGQHTPDGEPSRWLFDEGGKPWHDNLVDYRWRSTRTAAGTNQACDAQRAGQEVAVAGLYAERLAAVQTGDGAQRDVGGESWS